MFVFSSTLAARSALKADSWLAFLGGREVVAHGLPRHDALAVVSHGHQWVDAQWLAQLALYGLERAGGIKLVLLFSVALQLGALALGFAFARRRGASPQVIAPFAFLSWLAFNSWLRTQVFSQVLFVLLMWLLAEQSRKPTPRVFLALPLLCLWANLHGAVVVGAVLVALLGLTELVSLVRERAPHSVGGWWRAMTLLVTPWVCLLATPYGFSVVSYYHSTLANPAFRQFLTEWAPPTVFSAEGALFFALIAGAAVVVARRPRALTAFELAALTFTLVGALIAQRSIPWFAYGCLLLLPPVLQSSLKKTRRRNRESRLVGAVAIAVCLAAIVMLVTAAAWPRSRFTEGYPNQAAAAVAKAVQQHPKARVLATYELADWLLYTEPELRGRIAFDGRWELLSRTQISDALNYLYQSGTGWEKFGRGYSVFVLDPTTEAGLITTYDHRADMRALYRSPSAVVYGRIA